MQIVYDFKYDSFFGLFFTRFGGFGIDIFFAISGFVMYLSAKKANVSGIEFLLSRVFRIVPIYWFYTLLSFSIMLSRTKANLICFTVILLAPFLWPENILFSEVLNSPLLYEFISGFSVAFVLTNSVFIEILCKYKLRLILVITSFILSILCFKLFDLHISFRILSAGLIVFSVVLLDTYLSSNGRFVNFFITLGDFSYSTYLSHVFVIGLFLYFIGDKLNPIIEIIILSISLYFSSKYSYLLIEKNQKILNLKYLALKLINYNKVWRRS